MARRQTAECSVSRDDAETGRYPKTTNSAKSRTKTTGDASEGSHSLPTEPGSTRPRRLVLGTGRSIAERQQQAPRIVIQTLAGVGGASRSTSISFRGTYPAASTGRVMEMSLLLRGQNDSADIAVSYSGCEALGGRTGNTRKVTCRRREALCAPHRTRVRGGHDVTVEASAC